jgi:hypothetical protein
MRTATKYSEVQCEHPQRERVEDYYARAPLQRIQPLPFV